MNPVTPEEIEERRAALMAAEESDPDQHGLYWLSFADPLKPEGQRFNGVVIVAAHGPISAIQKAWDLNVNPGGEVMSGLLPNALAAEIPDTHRNRVLTREEAQEVGGS